VIAVLATAAMTLVWLLRRRRCGDGGSRAGELLGGSDGGAFTAKPTRGGGGVDDSF